MDAGSKVTQEQLPKILTTRVVRSLGCARDDRIIALDFDIRHTTSNPYFFRFIYHLTRSKIP